MNLHDLIGFPGRAPRASVAVIAVAAAALLAATPVHAQDDAARFDSPEAAMKALLDATASSEKGALRKIFGSAADELESGDEVQDREAIEDFGRRLSKAHKLAKNEDGSMTILVGKNAHPFPIPLVQKDGKWFFDTAAGKEEILNRRIGDNELRTLAVCRGIVVAQREYALVDRDGDDVLEYAQRGLSTPGKRDGLYFETAEGEDPSPLGPMAAEASAEGYGRKESTPENTSRPYHGYVYRFLTKQGAKAPGGKFDYIINGNMVAGYALIAYPIEYGNSGVMTFMVNANGKVLEKDLGETGELAAAITEYDPDETWKPSTD